MLQRFERNISILGRSPRTFDNYSRHVAAMALHSPIAVVSERPFDVVSDCIAGNAPN